MPEAIFDISADVNRNNRSCRVIAKQFDVKSRYLRVRITNHGRAVIVPKSAKVIINVRRPDGAAKAFSGVVNPDGTVKVPLHSWALELEGELRCDISVIGTDGSKLTTTSFNVTVERSTYSGDDVSQDPESMDIITEVLTEVNNRMPNYKIGPGLAVSENTLYVTAGTGGGGAPVDPTLSLEGAAADAKATGDAIKQIIDSANAEEPWDSGYWSIDPWINNEPGSAEGYSNSQTIQLEPNTKYTISISENDDNTLYIAGENGGIYSAVQEYGGYQTFTTDETGRQTFWLLTPGRRYEDYINGTIKASIVKGSLPKMQGKGVTKVSKDGWVIKTHENAPGELNNRYLDIYSPFGRYFSLNTGAYNDDPTAGDTWSGLTIGQPSYSGANEAGIHLAVPGSGMDISFMNAGILAELVFNMGVYGASLEYGKYMFAFNEPDVPSYARFQIFKDAIPIYLTAGGIKVKNNNQAVKNENEAEWKTVNLYELESRVAALEAQIQSLAGGSQQ